MKRYLSLALSALIPVLVVNEARGQTDPASDPLHSEVSLRLREEALDWFAPQPAPNAKALDETDEYFHAKLQAGLRYETKQYVAAAQLQYFQLADLEPDTIGPGATYFSTNGDESPGDLSVRQLSFTWNPSAELPVGFTAGRFLYANGNEAKTDDTELAQLKQRRIYNRVLGSFDFTGGRSFDGLLVRSILNGDTLAGSYLRPTQGGFATDASAEINEIQFTTLSYTSSLPLGHPNELQFFHYYFDDRRDEGVVKTDNRSLDERKADSLAIRIHNFGLSSAHVLRTEGVTYDALFWGVFQAGTWGEVDHRSGAFAAEAGARFVSAPWQPRLGVGYDWGRGDSSPGDDRHTTYFQMLPTARQYALIPFYNAMNNADLFAKLGARPQENVELTAGVHLLRLESGSDLLYSGGGANKSKDQFGFAGTKLSGSTDLGTSFELEASYKPFPWWTLGIFAGHLEGGDAFDGYSDGNVDYAFVETTFAVTR